ncbi:MAG: thermonuclease family protein [Pseudomonadota bacterium]
MLKCVLFSICLTGAGFAQTYSGPARVVDGDTLDLGLSENVRLYGIDAPENNQTCGALACGRMATAWLKKRIENNHVSCVTRDVDRFNRPVAQCRLSDGRDIGQMMVANGLAWAYLKYSNLYALDEKTAYLNKRGFWAHEFDNPATHRAAARIGRAPENCIVKGNISPNSGERIYHVEGQQHYEKVGIDLSKGEQCFETEAAARTAGWRKARR